MCLFCSFLLAELDKLDVGIIRAHMQGEPFLSIWSARQNPKPGLKIRSDKLGVTESTVRARYHKLSSFLSGWSFQLNPTLLGEKQCALVFNVPEIVSKEKVLDEL